MMGALLLHHDFTLAAGVPNAQAAVALNLPAAGAPKPPA